MTRDPRPRRAGELLRGSAAGIAARAHALDALTGALRRALPSDLAPHCLAASVRGSELVVFADAAAWATAIRFHAARLRQAAAAHGLSVRRVRTRVLAPVPRPSPPPRRRLSPAAGEALRATADAISDPALAAALRRLARLARRR